MSKANVKAFFDEATFTVTYVVSDPQSALCAIIDSVLDYDPASGRTSTASADAILAYIQAENLNTQWVLDTHVHADHLSAARYLREKTGAQTGIGAHITTIQETFGAVFNAEDTFARDGSQFDHLFAEGDEFTIGEIKAHVMHTPGHTPACVAYVIGDAVFVGDTIFMPDYGTARCDFPGGDAHQLYHSVRRIFALPDETKLYMCHDYKAPGRDAYCWESTVAEQRAQNVHIADAISEDAFVALRTERDSGLDMPQLILPSVQINMRAGDLPPPEDNGTSYLKIPLNAL